MYVRITMISAILVASLVLVHSDLMSQQLLPIGSEETASITGGQCSGTFWVTGGDTDVVAGAAGACPATARPGLSLCPTGVCPATETWCITGPTNKACSGPWGCGWICVGIIPSPQCPENRTVCDWQNKCGGTAAVNPPVGCGTWTDKCE